MQSEDAVLHLRSINAHSATGCLCACRPTDFSAFNATLRPADSLDARWALPGAPCKLDSTATSLPGPFSKHQTRAAPACHRSGAQQPAHCQHMSIPKGAYDAVMPPAGTWPTHPLPAPLQASRARCAAHLPGPDHSTRSRCLRGAAHSSGEQRAPRPGATHWQGAGWCQVADTLTVYKG